MLQWTEWGGGNKLTYFSRGDLGRILENVRSFHGLALPLGFFIPFDTAWDGVKEFIETAGRLPESKQWIAGRDVPPEAFPDPQTSRDFWS